MKITVIGGGITGCVISSYLADKGFRVDLHEASNKLGGVLKDIYLNKSWYYNDCHYLEQESEWLHELITETNVQVLEFIHKYGSYTHSESEELISKSFAGPVFSYFMTQDELERLTRKASLISQESNLDKRIACYPDKIYHFLMKWLSTQLGIDPKELSHFSSVALQISRIYLKDDESRILDLKRQNKFIDKLIGIPRTYIYSDSLKAVLPRRGFDDLFKCFYELLMKKKVNVNLSSFIRPVSYSKDNGKFVFVNQDSDLVKSDLIVWAASPIPIFKIISNYLSRKNEKRNSYLTRYYTYIFEFLPESEYFLDIPFYIQIFSLSHLIRRVYIYTKPNKKYIVSVESFKEIDNFEILNIVDSILRKFQYFGSLELIGVAKSHKKIILGLNEIKLLEENQEMLQNSNIIDGGWHLYGRESRISYVKSRLNNLFS